MYKESLELCFRFRNFGEMTLSWEFLFTSFIIVLLPGTGVIYTIAIGLSRGFKMSIAAAFGCTLGIVPAAVASIIGLAVLFHSRSISFQIIKYLGVTYLFYLAWKTFRNDGEKNVTDNEGKLGLVSVVVTGILINVLNPKLLLFFFAFLPQFVSPKPGNPTLYLIWLALVFMILTFLVFVIYGAFASYARDYVIQRPLVMYWLKSCLAGIFGFLGFKLAFSG